MTQALITINAIPGSNDDLPINQIVALNNMGVGGELTYAWSILDQPPGPADTLSASLIQNPTLTPKKEGSYLIKLVVNASLVDEKTNMVIVAVRQLKTRERQPAAGETREDDILRGWATSLNRFLVRVDTALADPGLIVGVNNSGGVLSRGKVVRVTSTVTIKVGLPGSEKVPGFSLAPATVLGNVDELLCVVEGTIDGLANVPNAVLMRVRYIGRFATIALGGSVGDTVFVDDGANLSLAAGTVRRQMGSIMAAGPNDDVWLDGVGGFDITPIGAPYVVYGNPGTLTNSFRIDGLNATGATLAVPYTFKAGDVTTIALIAKRFSLAGLSQLEVQSESGFAFQKFKDSVHELRTDLPDLNGQTLGAWQAFDVNSVAGDKRIATIVPKLSGTTANDRGGALFVSLKADSGSLIQALRIASDAINAIPFVGTLPDGTALVGAGVGLGAGVQGTSGPSVNAEGVVGISTGSGAGVRGTGGTTGAGVQGDSGTFAGAPGVRGTSFAVGSGNGVEGGGNGLGYGVLGSGGGTDGSTGVFGVSNATNGYGVGGAGSGNLEGGVFTGGVASGSGVRATSGGGNGYGIIGIGTGSGYGGYFDGQGNGASAGDDSINCLQNIRMDGSNATKTAGMVNRLNPSNLIKAWAKVTANGPAAPTYGDGFNVLSVTRVNNSTLHVTFAATMLTASYITLFEDSFSNTQLYTPLVTSQGPTGFDIQWRNNTTSSLTDLDTTLKANFVVIGLQ